MLGITDPFAVFCGTSTEDNPDEIDIESESEETTQDEGTEGTADDTADETAGDTGDESMNDTLDTSSSEQYPTFLHSQSAVDVSVFNDSGINETNQSKYTSPPVSQSNSVVHSSPASDNMKEGASSPLVRPLSLPKPKGISTAMLDETVNNSGAIKRRSVEDKHEGSSHQVYCIDM